MPLGLILNGNNFGWFGKFLAGCGLLWVVLARFAFWYVRLALLKISVGMTGSAFGTLFQGLLQSLGIDLTSSGFLH